MKMFGKFLMKNLEKKEILQLKILIILCPFLYDRMLSNLIF